MWATSRCISHFTDPPLRMDAPAPIAAAPPRMTGRAVSLVMAVAMIWFFADAYFFEGTAVVIDAVVLLLALAGVYVLAHEPFTVRRPDAVNAVAAITGAAVGHALTTRVALHPTLAGSLAGVAVSTLPLLGINRATNWMPVFYVGVFAGTGSSVILHGATWVLLAGLLAGLVWSLIPDAWSGVGGKMGFTAFFGAGTAELLSEHLAGNRPGRLPMQVIDLGHDMAVPVAAVAAVVTRRLMWRYALPAVAASALPTAFVAAGLFGFRVPLAAPLAAAWFGGSFVGMTQVTRIPTDMGIAATGALLGVVLLRLQSRMVGWGGVLGATACTCVLAGIGLSALARRIRMRQRMPAAG